VNEDQIRDLLERADQIRSLTQHPAWALLTDFVHSQLEAKQRALLGGMHDDLLRYKFDSGWVQGAMAVLHAPDRLDEQIQRIQQEAAQLLRDQQDAA
jgi:hypothetical protein